MVNPITETFIEKNEYHVLRFCFNLISIFANSHSNF